MSCSCRTNRCCRTFTTAFSARCYCTRKGHIQRSIESCSKHMKLMKETRRTLHGVAKLACSCVAHQPAVPLQSKVALHFRNDQILPTIIKSAQGTIWGGIGGHHGWYADAMNGYLTNGTNGSYYLWTCPLPQDRYNCRDSGSKEEIPVEGVQSLEFVKERGKQWKANPDWIDC